MLLSEKQPIGILQGNITNRTNNSYVFVDNILEFNYLEIWRPTSKPADLAANSVEYIVPHKYEFRADLISQLFYSTPVMAWAICYYNDILDPFDETTGLYVGRKLNIINMSYLNQVSS